MRWDRDSHIPEEELSTITVIGGGKNEQGGSERSQEMGQATCSVNAQLNEKRSSVPRRKFPFPDSRTVVYSPYLWPAE